MAYTFTFIGKKTGGIFKGYNLDYAVGPSSRNITDDVMLVQRLFNVLYFESLDEALRAEFPAPGPALVVDGKYGTNTKKFIEDFKKRLRAAGTNIYPDHVMDPFRNNEPEGESTISKTKYAFGMLLAASRQANPDVYDTLAQDTNNPMVLRVAISMTSPGAEQYGES
jgi:peptidoglycan hydrolase-like protein with peptidoglycan-binding domain